MSKRKYARFAELDRARGRRLILEARAARARCRANAALLGAANRAANDDLSVEDFASVNPAFRT